MTLPLVQSLTLATLLNSARSLQQTFCALFSVRWVEAGALQLGLSIPPRFVAQPRLLNWANIPGLTIGAITELLGTEALALLVKG